MLHVFCFCIFFSKRKNFQVWFMNWLSIYVLHFPMIFLFHFLQEANFTHSWHWKGARASYTLVVSKFYARLSSNRFGGDGVAEILQCLMTIAATSMVAGYGMWYCKRQWEEQEMCRWLEYCRATLTANWLLIKIPAFLASRPTRWDGQHGDRTNMVRIGL